MKRLTILSLLLNAIFTGTALWAVAKVGSPRYIFYLIKYRGNGIISLKKHKTDHLATLPKKMDKIMMLGNSITAECEWSELLENQDVINRGIIGDATDDILARLDDVIAQKPKQIFLLIGVNDLMFHPPQYVLSNYEKIVSKLRTSLPETQLMLESVLPVHNTLRRTGLKNEDIATVNAGISAIAMKNNLPYLDIAAPLKDASGALREDFSLDGIHLNGNAYALIGEIIKKYIKTNN